MASELRSFEEKKYAILSKESIKMMAEEAGHNEIPDEVAAILAEDVAYRLREATHSSCQYMRHAKRKKLTADDFNKALRHSDVEPVFGQSSGEPVNLLCTRELDIFFPEDPEISLIEAADDDVPVCHPGQTSVKGHWLAVEGTQKGVPVSQNGQGKTNGKVTKLISEDLLVYYDNMTKAILSNEEELMKVALADLRTNAKIVPLLPYFVNFVSYGVKKVSHDITQLTKLLHTIKALTSNTSLYLEPKPYLNMLVQGVMYCVTEPLAASINPLNDHWRLRDYAARLLAQITRQWNSPLNQLLYKNTQELRDILNDGTRPLSSHYGAIVGLVALGHEAIERILFPHLQIYVPHLLSLMKDTSYANALVNTDAHRVYSAILLASESVLRRELLKFQLQETTFNGTVDEISFVPNVGNVYGDVEMRSELADLADKTPSDEQSEKEKKQKKDKATSYFEMYKNLVEVFGDELSSRLPPIVLKSRSCPRKEVPSVQLYDTENQRSGEDLLAEFLDVTDVADVAKSDETTYESKSDRSYHSPYDVDVDVDSRSYRSDHSYRSDRSDDLSFLDDSSVDLTVKSTVNDPRLGIKLTITKRPKQAMPSKDKLSDRSKSESKHGRKKKLPKLKMIDFFEKCPLRKEQEKRFTFHVPGILPIRSTPRPRQFSIESDYTWYTGSGAGQFRKLTLKHPNFWKRKVLFPKTRDLKKVSKSGNIVSML
ncbi:TAF6-like RNA polymerase II p300/CBP-associated factor-associated factor 65 kDa subunit 6L [Lineus longissimus]|uniref:TAF6-like RNA polymerase II p300/CBP-associated factor-associated factor 65 kDa subunit 6L n=1 Tax=Lineus longissimus TaxID=88925 RepID=UPI002B4D03B1